MYDLSSTAKLFSFTFAAPNQPELLELKARYGLEAFVGGSGLDTLSRLCTWVHGLWAHDGWNEPSAPDALTILERAAEGKAFRCVEYSVVLASCASALGLPSRVVQLKTADSETREFGAGHVVAEVFLPDARRWVLADGQWNVVPLQNGQPLSALELRLALNRDSTITSRTKVTTETVREYLVWVDEYLYYFSTPLDNRDPTDWRGPKLVLGPMDAKEPTVFQQKFPLLNATYTHAANAFYPTVTGVGRVPV